MVSIKHRFQSPLPDDVDTDIVKPSDWNDEHVLVVNGNVLLGRLDNAPGPVQELAPRNLKTLIHITIPDVEGLRSELDEMHLGVNIYQYLAMHWAEYMPGQIPGNILNEMNLSGEHYSAKYWALKAQGAFGALSSLYLGAHPNLQAALGNIVGSVPPGSIYYDTTSSKPYIWDGSSWAPFWSPQKAITTTLHYRVTTAQTNFPLGTPDLFNNSFNLDKSDVEPLDIFVNGIRMFPTTGTPPVGDYTVDVANNQIVMAQPLPINAVVTIDVLTPRDKFAVGSINIHAILNIDLDPVTRVPGRIDGLTSTFPIVRADGGTLSIGSAPELLVSQDGVILQPGVDYNVVGSRLTFTNAPAPDSVVWAEWFEPGGTGGSGKGVSPPSPPDDLHTNEYEWDVANGAVWKDNRGRMHSVANAAARLALKDPDHLFQGSLVFERDTRNIWTYSPAPGSTDPTALTNWTLLLPGHPSDNILRSLEYDPARPNSMMWEDSRDQMETVGAEADLNNRVTLPLSHLMVGKLVYVRATGQLWECLIDGTTGTATNTIADWKQLGGAGVTFVGRMGNLPDPTTKSIPDGSLFMVNMDTAAAPYHRLYVFDATATNAAGVKGVYRPAGSRDFIKALRTDPDHGLDSVAGDLQATLEAGHKELKAYDAAGAWQTIYSEDLVKQWIAAGNLFQGTVQDAGHGTVGAGDLGHIPAESALGVTDTGHYWVFVGTPGHVVGANEIGGGPSTISGAKLNVGDWIIVANAGTIAAPRMQFGYIPGDLLAKARGDSLYGLNPWQAGAYEAGSLVVFSGDIYKAARPVLGADPSPGVAPTTPGATNPWVKVQISGGVKTVAADANLPAGAPNGAVYLVLSSAQAGGKGAMYMWDQPSSKWQALGGGGTPLALIGGKKLINYGTPVGTVITFAGKSLPPGYLLCDGAAFDGSIYPELQRVLGQARTPDLRNQFIRGGNSLSDVNFTKKPATTGLPTNHFTGVTNRTGQHTHGTGYSMSDHTWKGGGSWSANAVVDFSQGGGARTSSDGAHEHTVEITSGGDAETAPAHVVLVFLIKATDCATVEGT